MKNILFIVLFSFPLWGLGGCNNNDDSSNGALPAATQTGAGTFACKVNGKTFIDHSSTFNCYYQYNDGEYNFGINGNDDDYKFNGTIPWSIHLQAYNRVLQEGQTYQLKSTGNGNVYGIAAFSTSPTDGTSSYTNSTYTGELNLTKFDESTQIVSGTFWFDVRHPVTGETLEIREGRFDTHFGH